MSERHPITSRKKAHTVSTALFLLGLAWVCLSENWWPGIMLAIGLPLALRQYLLGRNYDMFISLLVFVGTYVTITFDISWKLLLPILFTIGALYILLREFLGPDETTEPEKEEALNHEIEEDKKK